ncbi:hypothetical protein JTB14_009169 [Gonioctena quinquepunctata]|nr:hypothetical protein JTB14_009169 [Gonioctena quinquepunctata]
MSDLNMSDFERKYGSKHDATGVDIQGVVEKQQFEVKYRELNRRFIHIVILFLSIRIMTFKIGEALRHVFITSMATKTDFAKGRFVGPMGKTLQRRHRKTLGKGLIRPRFTLSGKMEKVQVILEREVSQIKVASCSDERIYVPLQHPEVTPTVVASCS